MKMCWSVRVLRVGNFSTKADYSVGTVPPESEYDRKQRKCAFSVLSFKVTVRAVRVPLLEKALSRGDSKSESNPVWGRLQTQRTYFVAITTLCPKARSFVCL